MRVVVHQAIKSEDMIKKEPNKTKTIPYIGDSTNMYIYPHFGGDIGVVFCDSRFPGRAWDGFIFSENSDKLIDSMIEGLQWIKRNKKGIYNAKKEAAKARRSASKTAGV